LTPVEPPRPADRRTPRFDRIAACAAFLRFRALFAKNRFALFRSAL